MEKLDAFEHWWETYKPVRNTVSESRDGPSISTEDGEEFPAMFETFGNDLAFVRAADPKKVWSLLETDDSMTIVNGMRVVNLLGFYVTEVPFEGDFLEVGLDDGTRESDAEKKPKP